jgi:hypothetical protein
MSTGNKHRLLSYSAQFGPGIQETVKKKLRIDADTDKRKKRKFCRTLYCGMQSWFPYALTFCDSRCCMQPY